MPDLGLIVTFLRELMVSRTLPREPEPDLVMEGPDQVAAYANAGRIDGDMAASYLFQSARISMVINGCRNVLDLGCGPATQLAQIAQLNPDIEFLGVDLSSRMIADAQQYVAGLHLKNVHFIRNDIAELSGIADRSFDGVISTLALHHLPTLASLDSCFARVRQVLAPGGALYLTDFCRLKSLKSVLYFAYLNRGNQPHIFSLDYERSLRAAFEKAEFESLTTKYFSDVATFVSTFKVPFLGIVKTPDRPLSHGQKQQVKDLCARLPRRYRSDLDNLRRFFSLGGLKSDPFR